MLTQANLSEVIDSGKLDLPFDDIEPLGASEQGCFSWVYKARCRERRVPVVLKFASPAADSDPMRGPAFDREAKVLESLRGKPNVVEITHALREVSFELQGDLPSPIRFSFRYYGLALFPSTLLREIHSGGNSLCDMLRLFRQVASGMRQIHAESICHRDLKPGNCLVDGVKAVLADFGTARRDIREDAIGVGEAYQWQIWGDMRYVAPELFLGVRTFRDLIHADFYSLGCVLFEICTGQILAEQMPDAFAKLVAANGHLKSGSKRGRDLANSIIRNLEQSGYLPEIGLQPPVLKDASRVHVQRLFARLCAVDPQKRLVDYNELFVFIDQAIRVIAGDEDAGGRT